MIKAHFVPWLWSQRHRGTKDSGSYNFVPLCLGTHIQCKSDILNFFIGEQIVLTRVYRVLSGVVLFALLTTPVMGENGDGPNESGTEEMLAQAFAGVDEIVFAVRAQGTDGHWYANFGYWSSDAGRMMYGRDGGELCALNVHTGKLRTILDAGSGSLRDPHVHYDGKKILFSRRKSGSKYYHLYEINVDGTGLRQLTGGEFDDLEAVYLPDGGIMFVSSRCNRWVNCWHTQVAVLYRCDGDGSNIQIVSANIEQDNTPWVMPNGGILYTRWEYVDRSRVKYHHLWTMNPDGTGQMIHYGNMHAQTVMIDAKPIPGTGNMLSVFSPGTVHRDPEQRRDLRPVCAGCRPQLTQGL